MGHKNPKIFTKNTKRLLLFGEYCGKKTKRVGVFVGNDVDASRGELYQNYKNSVYSAIVVLYESWNVAQEKYSVA